MQWRGRRESGNIEDRRGMSGGQVAFGGIGGLIIAAIVYFLGGNPNDVLQQQPPDQAQTSGVDNPNDTLDNYVSVVLADTEDIWDSLFNAMNSQYVHPKLVLFSGATDAACGHASSATGPFYCPSDQKV